MEIQNLKFETRKLIKPENQESGNPENHKIYYLNSEIKMVQHMDENHFRKLERLYCSAPINRYYEPKIIIEKGTAEICIAVKEDFFHSGSAVHGSVFFKALDDAAYFAVNSLVGDCMLVTVTFSVSFIRPITSGVICAKGVVIQHGKKVSFAESSITDERGRLFAKGSGTFMKSEVLLSEQIGYK